MNKTIWKYTIDPTNLTIEMPKEAIILTAREQGDNICLWVEVDPCKLLEPRIFEVFGTGHDIPIDMGIERKYIGTAIIYSGTLIFHVYERIN